MSVADHAQRAHPATGIRPRPRLLSVLSGPERLVVVHGPLLSGKSTLLRQWLSANSLPANSPPANPLSDGTTAGTVDPDPGLTGDRYWSRVVTSLRAEQGALDRTVGPDGSASLAVDPRADPFDEVKALVRAWRGPLTLVLDDVHLVEDPETRVRDLLDDAPPGGSASSRQPARRGAGTARPDCPRTECSCPRVTSC